MQEYIIEPKSRKDLRRIARVFREHLHLDDKEYFPIVEVLEILPEIFKGFSFEIVGDDELPTGVHADTDIVTGHVRIRESVYDGACVGNGRDRMTIAHEISHFIELSILGFKLQRNFSSRRIESFRDPEWHAKCLAGEIMVPAHLMKDASISAIMEKCGVSEDAARCQYRHIHEKGGRM